MQTENSIFFFHDADKQLFFRERDGTFGQLTPERIEVEMRFVKSAQKLRVHKPTQEGLEFFVRQYGSTYETLYLDDCTCLNDLSPLAEMSRMSALCIERCRNINTLWDLSTNCNLRILSIREAKSLTLNPTKINTSQTLEELRFWGGGPDHKYHMHSLLFLRNMQSLKRIDLNSIILDDHSMSVLETLPALEEFHFDASMLTTEEIAQICVQHPHLTGQSLGAYSKDEVMGEGTIRICGYRKPALSLPEDQKKLEWYVRNFEKIKKKFV